MRVDTLDILRCPFCGGRLELVSSLFHQRTSDEIEHGILGCHCCIFPVVSGIPVLHLDGAATTAREHLSAGHVDLARRALFNLEDGWFERFEEADASGTATYRDVLQALGPAYERGYFLYRFSDPSYVVAHALVRAAAGTALR